MQRSPYTPGVVTTEVFGREQHIDAARRELLFMKVDPQFGGRIHVNVGMRGVGKTSLLRTIQKVAEEEGFHTVYLTAGDQPLLEGLSAALIGLSTGWADGAKAKLGKILSRLTVNVGPVGIAPGTQAGAESGAAHVNHARAVQEALEVAAKEVGKPGLILFIDEIQESDPEGLKSLSYAWQHMQTETAELPIMLFTAGLSHSQDVITDAVSFAERFNYSHLERLSDSAAREALESPARAQGVEWTSGALDTALSHASGYPYFLQLIGDYAWQKAGYPDPGQMLTESDVEEALKEFASAQDSFFRARWTKASSRERDVLTVLARSHGEATRQFVASELGVKSDALGMVRRSLLDKGLIETPGHGRFSLSVPGFAEFILREITGEETDS